MRARRRWASLVGALALLPAVASAQLPGDTLEIVDVRFDGARAFSSTILSTAILTTPTHCSAIAPICWLGIGVDHQFYDEITAQRDVLRLLVFYAQRGYRQARVELESDRADDGIVLHYRIQEGEPTRVVEVDVRNLEGISSDIARNLPLRDGMPFDLLLLETSRDTLQLRLENRGYADAEVLINYEVPQDSLIARVSYDLYPGRRMRFGEPEVVGATKVTPAVVRKMLTFRPGDVYSRDAILRSQRNIFSQELFRHADIQTSVDPEADSLLAVQVRLTEGDVHRVRAGLGLSTAEYLITEGRWVSRNFQGGARRLELRVQLSNLLANALAPAPGFENLDRLDDIYTQTNGQVSADFTQPWFFSPYNTFRAGLFVERRSLPGVFVRTGGGGNVSFRRLIGRSATIDVGIRPELSKLESPDGDLVFCVNFTACDERQIRALAEPHWLVPLTASLVWDRSNSLFSPNRGWVIRVNSEFASAATASDFEYARVSGDFIDYSAIVPGWIIATRLSPGVAIPMHGISEDELGVHPTRRFYAGGPNSIRGYAQFRLGPKALTIDPFRLLQPADSGGAACTPQAINRGECDARALASDDPDAFNVQPLGGAASFEGSFELRFPIFREVIRGAAFVDYGQVWREHTDMRLRDLVITPGLGIRYYSPIGPIRIDVGYNPKDAETVRVFTTRLEFCPGGGEPCQPLEDDRIYDRSQLGNTRALQPQPDVMWNPRTSFLKRLQLHFSIGQAF